MREYVKTCDKCGAKANVCCDLVVPHIPMMRFPMPFWPWKNNDFDLCSECASRLLVWLKEK